jgi:hypothetical protein
VVYEPPQFTQQPQSGSAEVQGNTKVLLCHARGNPTPVYRWNKDGVFINENNTTDTSLKIQNIQRKDAGEYQCVASNTLGAILSDKVHVHVACKFHLYFKLLFKIFNIPDPTKFY